MANSLPITVDARTFTVTLTDDGRFRCLPDHNDSRSAISTETMADMRLQLAAFCRAEAADAKIPVTVMEELRPDYTSKRGDERQLRFRHATLRGLHARSGKPLVTFADDQSKRALSNYDERLLERLSDVEIQTGRDLFRAVHLANEAWRQWTEQHGRRGADLLKAVSADDLQR